MSTDAVHTRASSSPSSHDVIQVMVPKLLGNNAISSWNRREADDDEVNLSAPFVQILRQESNEAISTRGFSRPAADALSAHWESLVEKNQAFGRALAERTRPRALRRREREESAQNCHGAFRGRHVLRLSRWPISRALCEGFGGIRQRKCTCQKEDHPSISPTRLRWSGPSFRRAKATVTSERRCSFARCCSLTIACERRFPDSEEISPWAATCSGTSCLKTTRPCGVGVCVPSRRAQGSHL